MASLKIEDFLELRKQSPVLDVRSESEFEDGHIPGAFNIPLLNNHERSVVGTDYKQKGQTEAIKTGFRLVGPRLEQMVEETKRFASDRDLLIYCWRGGMRSKNFCGFISMAGVQSNLLKGGYKAYREKAFETFNKKLPLIVIGGKTGSGKSELIRKLEAAGEQVLDLEQMANHKGSAFGGLLQPPQPTNEQFSNELFETIYDFNLNRPIWVEDESIAIGKIFLPKPFFDQKKSAPVIQIEVDKQIRIERLVQEYGPADRSEFLAAMERIIKKLGGQLFNEAKDYLLRGDLHHTINILLTYYDKAYLSSLEKKSSNIEDVYTWDGKKPEKIIFNLRQWSALHFPSYNQDQ